MLRIRLGRLVGVLVAGLYFSSLAHAQGVRVFAMASGSYLFDEKFFTIPSSGDQFRSNYATGGKITFGGEVTPWKILGFEGSYGIGRNNLRVADLTVTPPNVTGYGVRAQRYMGNAVLHSPVALGGLRPYLTGGLEYDRLAPSSEAKTLAFTQGFAGQVGTVLGASNLLGVNLGGGVEWGLFPTLGLRLDLRNHIIGTPTYGLPQGSASIIYPVSGHANNLEISAGITLHVGR
jgi:outer membrane protein with beta-barrel domain